MAERARPMTFGEFERRAEEVFEEVPPHFREGVDGLRVEMRAEAHPDFPEVYTLGECLTETYPTETGGAGEVRSFVVLYYGSFLRLSRMEEEWDWEEEIWETVTHEIRHHLESLASDDALEVLDYAEDQNFARREGTPFDPRFYLSGEATGEDGWTVDGDLFIERGVRSGGAPAEVEWEGRRYRVPLPSPLGDVHFATLDGVRAERGEVVVVLVRRRGLGESLRAFFRGRKAEVLHSVVRPEEA